MPIAVSGFEHLAGEMLSLYEETEDQMLRKMAKNLSDGTMASNWTRKKYGQARDVKRQLRSVLSDLKTERKNLAEGFVKTAYGQSSLAFVDEAKRFTDALGITALSPNSPKVAAILSELDKNLAAEDRFILRRSNDAYADIVGRVSAKVATGSITYRQAVKEELNRFADRGIAGFVDKAGRHWDMATYAEMATLTAIERATIEGYCDTMASYGYDLAIISSHAGACPLCVAWEDVIVSVSGESNEYPSLEEAENAGCFHPRCLHHLSTYYEGVTHKGRNAPRPVQEPSNAYSSRQTQRAYEREVRRWKRRMAVASDPQSEREAYAHVRHYQQKIRNLIDSYDEPNDRLMRKYWREGGTQKLSDAAKKLKPVQLTGGKKLDFWQIQERKDKKAAKAYERIRGQDDIAKIAKVSGMSEEDIRTIKNHVFFDQHQLYDGKGRFDPDYDMAVAWDRLAAGKPEERDILLLNHELLESQIEKGYNVSASEAHAEASKKNDWSGYILEHLGEGGEADDLLQ